MLSLLSFRQSVLSLLCLLYHALSPSRPLELSYPGDLGGCGEARHLKYSSDGIAPSSPLDGVVVLLLSGLRCREVGAHSVGGVSFPRVVDLGAGIVGWLVLVAARWSEGLWSVGVWAVRPVLGVLVVQSSASPLLRFACSASVRANALAKLTSGAVLGTTACFALRAVCVMIDRL